MHGSALRSMLQALVLTTLTACGSNNADVPKDLIDAIRGQGGGDQYPAGPYGTREGDTIQNLCFDGWTNPKAAGFDPAKVERICLSDLRGGGARLLLVESCAIWCGACKAEYGGSADTPSLAEDFASRESRGFRILGTLFEDASSEPATASDAAGWAEAYDLEFPFAADPDHQIAGLFASSTAAPFNLLVDVSTMKIVLELEGYEPATLFGAVDQFLSAP